MSRQYNVIAKDITVAGATTLIGIRPATTFALKILRMWVGFNGTATSAQNRIEWGRQAAALAAGTCGINASAEGAGTKTPIGADTFNSLNGWLWVATPPEAIILAPSSASSFYLWFPTAPSVLTGWHAGVTFEEVG